MEYTIHKTEYLSEENLEQLWTKIKQYVAAHTVEIDGSTLDITQYVTKEQLTEAINNIPEIDLTPYETKEELVQTLQSYALANHNHDGIYQPVGDYLTEHQDLSSYAKKSEIPTVPTNVSVFNNDAGYLKEHQSLEGYAHTTDIPTKTSELTNDSTFTTKEYVDNLLNSIVNGDEVSY